jgi:hypothetical protein
VEIETLKAQAEVEPLRLLASQIALLKEKGGTGALDAYVRNVRLGLYAEAGRVLLEVK